MVIVKRDKKWLLLSKRTGRRLGTHDTREEAVAQETAINIQKARKKGHYIPLKRKK